ncbi:hypothetical protein Y032_0067g105 [Ancylostoma ceylanicum]|uniref:Uncharacterized protein n=1 Tax=Ancylostoma ceylanicum TaxID=53326 RepID=A0A016TYG9_9BILA|nr:hypothetical protein Y032_0067g105 [Ancylostoma ceylanicum]
MAASITEDDETIKRILFDNGYNSGEVTTWRSYSAPDGIALRSRLKMRLIFEPPSTFKEILTSSSLYENGCDEKGCRYLTDQKICHLSGAMYLIKC